MTRRKPGAEIGTRVARFKGITEPSHESRRIEIHIARRLERLIPGGIALRRRVHDPRPEMTYQSREFSPLSNHDASASGLDKLSHFIRQGDTVLIGQSHAEPLTLMKMLVAQRHEIGAIRLFLGIGSAEVFDPGYVDVFDYLSYCGSGSNRMLAKARVLDILPVHYSQLPKLISSGALRVDVVMVQVSPPDEQGRYSLGLSREYLPDAIKRARVVIAEVHPDVPSTIGGPYLRPPEIGLVVHATEPLPNSKDALPGHVEKAIGERVASLVDDGATLQTGIGSIPDAVLAHLADHRELGVHTGSMGDGIVSLCEAGVITNSRKEIDTGISVGGVLIGSDRLRRFAHKNAGLRLCSTAYTHNPQILGRIDRFVAINSAVEVDLTGQVNAEVAAGTYVGAIGGICDFLRAAQSSKRGVPIIALPSAAKGLGRIVTSLSGPVTVARSDACVIVTEYGVADLRGLTIAQRIPRMIGIAHPDQREQLERDVRQRGLFRAGL